MPLRRLAYSDGHLNGWCVCVCVCVRERERERERESKESVLSAHFYNDDDDNGIIDLHFLNLI